MEKESVHPTRRFTASNTLHGLSLSMMCFNILDVQSARATDMTVRAIGTRALFLSLIKSHAIKIRVRK